MNRGPIRTNHQPQAMSLGNYTETELLASAMQFDEYVLGELYDRYETKIYT